MPTLSEALAQPDHRVRLAALKAALDGEDRSAPDSIVGLVASEAHPKVRNAMALVVGKLGTRAHAPALCRLLRDADPGVRLRAVEGIAALKDSGSYPALVALLVAETDPKVRDFCAHHLVRLGGDNLMKLFQHMLVSDVGWVKESVILALALFNSPRVVPMLRGAHQKEEGPLKDLAFKGLEKLAGMGNELAVRAVAEIQAEHDAKREPKRLDVDFANLEDDTDAPNFEDTYTGKLPRIEIVNALEEDEEPEPADGPAAPAPSLPSRSAPSQAADAQAMGSGREKRPGMIKPPSSGSRDDVPAGLVAPPEGGMFPAEPPPPEPEPVAASDDEPAPLKASGRRPRPVPPSGRTAAPADNYDGGVVPPRGRGEDQMRPCPRCGAEISVGARRCRHCSEVFTDEIAAADASAGAQVPFDLAFVAVLSMILGGVEAFHQFTTGMAADAILGTIMGILHLAEIAAAVAAFRGFAWGWYLWWPISFFLFVVGASHGEAISAGRAFACLVSLSRTPTREFCTR